MEAKRLRLLALGIAAMVVGAATLRHFLNRDALDSVFDPSDRSNRVAHDFLDDLNRCLVLSDTAEIQFGAEEARQHYHEPDPRSGMHASGILSRDFGIGKRAGFACGNEVRFRFTCLRPRDLVVALEGLGLDDDGPAQRITIRLENGNTPTEITTTEWPRSDSPTRTEFTIPAIALISGENVLHLEFARTIEREFQGMPGRYAYAAALTRFEVLDRAAAERAARAETIEKPARRPDLRGRVELDDVVPAGGGAPRRALVFAAGDRLILPITLPPGRPRFVGSLFVHPDDGAPGVRPKLTVRYRAGTGGKLLIATGDLDAEPGDPRRRTALEIDTDLSPFSNTQGVIEIESDPGTTTPPLRLALAGPSIRGGQDLPRVAPPLSDRLAELRTKLGKPNIAIVLLDAAAARHFTAYGADREFAPTVDTLALEGLVFENAFSPASYTLPSVGSLFTGLLPDRHGVVESGAEGHKRRLADSVETLAQRLGRAGYTSEAWVTNPNAGKDPGYDRGFTRYDELFADPRLWNEGVAPEAVVEHAKQRLAEGALPEPFFLYTHFFPPHAPYRAPERFRAGLADPRYSGPADGSRASIEAYRREGADYLPRDLEELRALYRANLLYADDGVRQLLLALSAAGKLDRTIIVVVADHGEAFGEHRNLEHGDTTFCEETAVPWIVHFPRGIEWKPSRVRGPASLIDVVPTLLTWTGIPFQPDEFDGCDLTARMFETRPVDERLRAVVSRSLGQRPRYSIRTLDHSYHEDTFTRERWLFDLRADPREEVPIRSVDSALAEALRGELCRILCERPHALGERIALTPEQLKMSQEIGYLEGWNGAASASSHGCPLVRR